MIHTPKKNNTLNFFITFVLFLVLHRSLSLGRRHTADLVWQGLFFIFAIVISEFMIKFFLPVYTYIFDSESFKITKTLGKKTVTVCHIDNEKITSLMKREEYKKEEDRQVSALYNYSGNLKASSSYVLIFEYSSTAEAVIFEPSEEMARAILDVIKSR